MTSNQLDLSRKGNIISELNLMLASKTLILLFIILTSGFLRFWQLPERFWWGGVEGSFIWDIWYVAQGHPTLIGFESAAIGGLNFPPFLLYFLVPFFWLSGGNPIYIGIIVAILGVLTSVLFFLIGKQIFSLKVGLIAALIYAFSSQAISIDHKFIGGTFMIPVSLLVIFLLWQIYQKQQLKAIDLVILGSLIGLSFSAHYQAIFIFAAVFLFLILAKKQFLSIKNVLFFIISAIFWLTPLLLFDLRHDFYHFKGFITLLTGYTNFSLASGILVSGQYLLQNFLGLFWQPAYSFKFANFGVLPILAIIFAISAIFYFLLWGQKSLAKFKPIFFYFAILFLLGFGILSFYRSGDYQFDYYYWYLVPPSIFLVALVLDWFFKKRMVFITLALLAAFLVVNLVNFSNFTPTEPYNLVNQNIQIILADSKNRNLDQIKVGFLGTEVGPYDYLFYWYSKKFGIAPSKIVLISQREQYQERNILGSGQAPIKILPKSAGANLKPNYQVTASGVQILASNF